MDRKYMLPDDWKKSCGKAALMRDISIPAKRSFFPYVTKLRIKLRLKLRFEKMLSDSSIFGQVQLTPFSNHFKGHYPITGLDMHHHSIQMT